MRSLFSRAMVYGLVVLLGLLCALPNLLSEESLKKLPDWYAKNQLTLGLDLRGGSHLLLAMETESVVKDKDPAQRDEIMRDLMERSLEIVRRRLDETGMVEPLISRQGRDTILVQLPGVDDPAYIRELLGTTATMSFHWVAQQGSPVTSMTLAGQAPGEVYRLEKPVALAGEHIKDARLAYNQQSGEPVVSFRLDNEGARRFGDMTSANIGRALAIVLDNRVITAPVIRGAITGGSGEISGHFTTAEANHLALMLRSGALPVPLKVIEERTVGPDLGRDAIAMGISTGVLGALLVLGFMAALYGRWGLIASFGLSLNLGLIFGVLSLFGATLTLPGIAGIILVIGMAVDANILINERIREETERGASAPTALKNGFDKAYNTILDSNVTTLIAISLLFLFGSGPIRGFAITMAIGLLLSMFTAIAITRLIMEWRVGRMGDKPLLMGGLREWFKSRKLLNINFMRARYAGLIASAALSLASLVLVATPGMNYGIDFSGGSLVEVSAPQLNVEQIRAGLSDQNMHLAIQEFGEPGNYLVRLPPQSAEEVASGSLVADVKSAITRLSENTSFPRVETVGPRVSGDFADASIIALLVAGVGMLGYLWLRFESHFAIGAILTIALDLTKTLGFFVLCGVEFNLTAVAALLALIGYSVNDKVVVFDRIREKFRTTPDKPLLQLFNESINTTLTRTVFTSLTTMLAILPMAIAGGTAVSSFAWPMLFGVLVGTSSSIFIAAPIVYFLGERRIRLGKTQLRASREEQQTRLDALP